MRISPLFLALGVAASTIAVPGIAQRPAVDPASAALVAKAESQLEAGDLVAADDTLEAALVLDPKNVGAFVAMAKVAVKQQLYGQAIAFGRKALTIDPSNREALAVQGEAMVQLGALERARKNLAQIGRLCPDGCAEQARLAALIERGPMLAAKTTEVEAKAN